MSARCGKSPALTPSPSPLYLTFDADPTTPAYETVQTTLANGKTTQGRVCDICGRIIPIGSKGSLHAFNTHKSACIRKNDPGERAGSLSAVPSTRSLSPLTIPNSSLAPSPSGSPASPSHSPIFGPTHPPFDIVSDPRDREFLTNAELPRIAVDPPSDDLGSLFVSLPLSPSSQASQTSCIGITVQWRPGTVWETYPFPSHSFVRHPWHILEVCPPEHLRLRSADCTSTVSLGSFESTCHNCLRIPQSEAFQTIQNRAEGALPHTPYHLLSFEQLSAIPKKMKKLLDCARIKVVTLWKVSMSQANLTTRMSHCRGSSQPAGAVLTTTNVYSR